MPTWDRWASTLPETAQQKTKKDHFVSEFSSFMFFVFHLTNLHSRRIPNSIILQCAQQQRRGLSQGRREPVSRPMSSSTISTSSPGNTTTAVLRSSPSGCHSGESSSLSTVLARSCSISHGFQKRKATPKPSKAKQGALGPLLQTADRLQTKGSAHPAPPPRPSRPYTPPPARPLGWRQHSAAQAEPQQQATGLRLCKLRRSTQLACHTNLV